MSKAITIAATKHTSTYSVCYEPETRAIDRSAKHTETHTHQLSDAGAEDGEPRGLGGQANVRLHVRSVHERHVWVFWGKGGV